MTAALGLLASCNPVQSEKDFDQIAATSEELSNAITFTQYSKTDSVTAQENGNWITYTTSPARPVTIYNLDADGNENMLSYGKSSGSFMLSPKRGASTQQTVYVRMLNSDGTLVNVEKTLTVEVPTELTKEVRLLASDAYGSKVWKWDTEARSDGSVWGNIGYAGGDGSGWETDIVGAWWGATPEGLLEQLDHSDTGIATGEEDAGAYMVFDEEGKITTYDASGKQIRSGKYSVSGYTGERNQPSIDGSQANWALGTMTTTAGAILFPFKINGGGEKPTSFELVQLDGNHLKLVYAAEGTGSWSEATWWAFKSASDAEVSLTNFDTKSWTWDTEARSDGGAWGNIGYAGGDGSGWENDIVGCWWGCPPADLAEQLQHSDTGEVTGEEDPNAYMTFNYKSGKVTTFDANGNQLRQGNFEIQNWGNGFRTIASIDGSQSAWALGNLHTDAGSILWPFQINGNGTKPTDFEIVLLDANHLRLVYAAPGTGSWGEATWWAFKAKK